MRGVMADEGRAVRFMQRIEEAQAFPMAWKARGSDGFNMAGDHVLVLLEDAVSSFFRRSYGTSIFLALTAIEETAKAELMLFRRGSGAPKGRDPMKSHQFKHALGVRETTFMGRLPSVLGQARCETLHAEADAGDLVPLREAALYADVKGGEIITPKYAVSFDRAREIVLLAIEAADDALIGYTNRSMEAWSPFLDALFVAVTEAARD